MHSFSDRNHPLGKLHLQQTPKHRSLCRWNKVSNCLMWSWPLTIRIPIKNHLAVFPFFLWRLWSDLSLDCQTDVWSESLCACLVAWILNQTRKSKHQQLVDFACCLHSHISVLNGGFMQSFVPHPLLRWTMIFGHNSDTRIPRLPLLRTWNCWKCCQLIAPSGPISVGYWMVLSWFWCKHLVSLSCTGLVALIDGASGICRVSFLCWEAEGPRSGFQPQWHNILIFHDTANALSLWQGAMTFFWWVVGGVGAHFSTSQMIQ